MAYLEKARQVLQIELEGIRSLMDQLDDSFNELVESCLLVLSQRGKLILSGVGKSGQVGQKLASTLSSTGSRACFLHPVEAMHGDLGILEEGDLFLALSYSGETDELVQVLPAVRRLGAKIVAITGNRESSLAQLADLAVTTSIDQEACPFNLAPTATTTAMMAYGDALAMVLMEQRNFQLEDYGRLHPSGAIGRSVTMQVDDIMRSGDAVAIVRDGDTVKDAVLAMCRSKGGMSLVLDDAEKLVGVFTTGDLKRGIASDEDLMKRSLREVMVVSSLFLQSGMKAVETLAIFQKHKVNALPVLDAEGKALGLVDLQDLPKFKVL